MLNTQEVPGTWLTHLPASVNSTDRGRQASLGAGPLGSVLLLQLLVLHNFKIKSCNMK